MSNTVKSFKPAIVLCAAFLAAAIATGHVGLWILFVVFSLLIAVSWFIAKFNPKYDQKAIDKLGLELKYSFENALGIDEKNEKVYICTDKPRAFDKSQIRSVETESSHQVRHNMWGYAFHKDKNCKLVIHVADLDQPIHVIGFDKKEEMEKWFSRLSVFCNLA